MKKLTLLSAVAFLFYGTTASAQSSFATNNSLPQNQTLGFNGTGPGGAKDLEIRNDYNRPIEMYTNGIQRVVIQNGTNFNTQGNAGFGNNLPNGFAPQSRIHIHQTAADNSLQITNDGTGVSTNDGSRVTVNSNNDPLRNGNTFIYNQENRHLLLSTNANTDAANFNNAVTNNTLERVRVTAVGTPTFTPAAGYGVFNPANLTANTTRVSISYEPTVPVTRPLSLLHIGFNAGSTALSPPGSVDGWRPWMDIGTYTTNGADNMYFGLKNEGSTERQDAVIGWGDDDATLVTTDNLRFIFTADALSAGPEPSKQANGLEIARMEATMASTINPTTQNFGMMGIGNFYNSGIAPVDAKLDINGDLRIRQVDNKNQLTRVLVVDENDLNRVHYREASTLNTDNQTLSINGNLLSISGGNTVTLPSGGGGGNATADNGLTINPAGNVQLGGAYNGLGNPNGAELLNDREIPLNTRRLLFSGEGRIGFGLMADSKISIQGDDTWQNILIMNDENGANALRVTDDRKYFIDAQRVNGNPDAITIANVINGTTATGSSYNGVGINTTTTETNGKFYGASINMVADGNSNNVPGNLVTGLYVSSASSGIGNGNYIGIEGNAIRPTDQVSGVKIGIKAKADNPGYENIGVLAQALGNTSSNSICVGIRAQGFGAVDNLAGEFLGSVHVNGDIIATGTITPSDNMFKTNQQPLTNASAIIAQLVPKTYHLDSANFTQFGFDTKQHMGLIAQEVEQVLPNLVTNEVMLAQHDTSGAQTHARVDYKGVNYEEFIPLLIAGMQEQKALIDSLTNEVAALNNCVNSVNLCNPQARPANNGGSIDEGTVIQLENVNSIILDQNVPNPFAEKTTINYVIGEEVNDAQLMFYNTQGRIIKQVSIAERGEGKLTIYGENLEKGIYTYSLIADGEVIATKKMVKQ